jgi:hypothetical protein
VFNLSRHDSLWLVEPDPISGYITFDELEANADGRWVDRNAVFGAGTKRGTRQQLILVALHDAPTERLYDQADFVLGLQSLSSDVVLPYVLAKISVRASGKGR